MAPDLLGKLLVVDRDGEMVSGRIIETEAYTRDDPASHSYNGPTARNAVMFGPAGRLYVYLSYGIHCCANVVTGADGDGQAVLLRAVVPLEGLQAIRRRRPSRPDGELTNGPGKLCAGMGLSLADAGTDLTRPHGPIRIVDDGGAAPTHLVTGPRIGITRATETPWRFRGRW